MEVSIKNQSDQKLIVMDSKVDDESERRPWFDFSNPFSSKKKGKKKKKKRRWQGMGGKNTGPFKEILQSLMKKSKLEDDDNDDEVIVLLEKNSYDYHIRTGTFDEGNKPQINRVDTISLSSTDSSTIVLMNSHRAGAGKPLQHSSRSHIKAANTEEMIFSDVVHYKPEFAWMALEILACVKIQAAYRRFKTMNDLFKAGKSTAAMRRLEDKWNHDLNNTGAFFDLISDCGCGNDPMDLADDSFD